MSLANAARNANGGSWIDFYALLDVPMDSDNATLRRVIGAKYTAAASNYDHRDLEQRYYYQALAERILPQCRRILLDSQKRKLYDAQCSLHRQGDGKAMDYVTFMASLKNPEAVAKADFSLENLPAAPDGGGSGKLQDEVKAAQELVHDMESGLALDLLPSTSVTSSSTPTATPHDVQNPHSVIADSSSNAIKAQPQSTAAPAVKAEGRSSSAPPPEDGAQEASRVFDEAFVRVAGAQPYLESTNLTSETEEVTEARRARRTAQEAGQGEVHAQTLIINGRKANSRSDKSQKQSTPPASRLTVGETKPRTKSGQRGRGVLSPTSLNLMTAIVAVLLTITIQYFTNTPVTATSDSRVPLIVSYSSEMQPFLEQAKAEFEKTENGALIEVVLQPQDSYAGMRSSLGLEGSPPDVWIPSESMWPQRYNKLAASHNRSVINSSAPLALSPLVLVARSDHANKLKKRFPNRQIPSWEAMRIAVAQDAPGRLGLTDPNKSGSGAITRYFMARDWSQRNDVSWNNSAVSNASLWKWMASVEKNIPATSGMTAEMVKDMVLGTRGLYWWAIAYESDAVYWINQGKLVEIFYLPMTNFADHPFCHVARLDAHPQARTARILFERFLRTQPIQEALLENGFRPTEIDLQTKTGDNPFLEQKFKQRGLKNTGFPLDERLDYQLINSLNKQWDKRFTS